MTSPITMPFDSPARYLAGCLRAGGRQKADVYISKIETALVKENQEEKTEIVAETYSIRNPSIDTLKIFRVTVHSLILPSPSSSSSYSVLDAFDLVLVLCGPEDLNRVSHIFPKAPPTTTPKKKKKSASNTDRCKAVVLLSPFLRLNVRAPEEIAFETRTKQAGAMLFNGAIGFDVVRHRTPTGSSFDIFEPLWNGRLILQRMDTEQQKGGGARFLKMIESSRIRVDYRSGVWKSIWGTAILQTSIHAASALMPHESARGLLSRRRMFRCIVAELVLESERVILRAFRDPRGRRQWQIDISACVSGPLSFLASTTATVDVLFRLPNCVFSALFRLVAFENFVPGALTSAQRDVNILAAKTKRRDQQKKGGNIESRRNGLVCVRALRKISKLARTKNVPVPVTNRVLDKLVRVCENDHDGGTPPCEETRLWQAVLADDGNDCLSRSVCCAFESALKIFLKAALICVFAVVAVFVMGALGMDRGTGLFG
eukprot:g3558.t1